MRMDPELLREQCYICLIYKTLGRVCEDFLQESGEGLGQMDGQVLPEMEGHSSDIGALLTNFCASDCYFKTISLKNSCICTSRQSLSSWPSIISHNSACCQPGHTVRFAAWLSCLLPLLTWPLLSLSLAFNSVRLCLFVCFPHSAPFSLRLGRMLPEPSFADVLHYVEFPDLPLMCVVSTAFCMFLYNCQKLTFYQLGAYDHSVLYTTAQLTEGRSARDQPKQPPAKKKASCYPGLFSSSFPLFGSFFYSHLTWHFLDLSLLPHVVSLGMLSGSPLLCLVLPFLFPPTLLPFPTLFLFSLLSLSFFFPFSLLSSFLLCLFIPSQGVCPKWLCPKRQHLTSSWPKVVACSHVESSSRLRRRRGSGGYMRLSYVPPTYLVPLRFWALWSTIYIAILCLGLLPTLQVKFIMPSPYTCISTYHFLSFWKWVGYGVTSLWHTVRLVLRSPYPTPPCMFHHTPQ